MPVTKILASDIDLKDQSLTTTKTEFEDDDLVNLAYVELNYMWSGSWDFFYNGFISEGYYFVNINCPENFFVSKITVYGSGNCYLDFLSGLVDSEYPLHEDYLFFYDSGVLKEWRYDGVADDNSVNFKSVNFPIKKGNSFCFHLINSNISDLQIKFDLVRDFSAEVLRKRIIYDEVVNYSRINVNCVDFGTNVSTYSFYDFGVGYIYFPPSSRVDKYYVRMDPTDGSSINISMPDIAGYDKSLLAVEGGAKHRNGKYYAIPTSYDCWVVFDPVSETFDYKTSLELSGGEFSLLNAGGTWGIKNSVTTNEGEIYFLSQSSVIGSGYIYYIDKLGVLKRKVPPVDFWPSNVVYYTGKFNEAQPYLNGKLLYSKYSSGYTSPIYSYDYRKNTVASIVSLPESITGGNHYVSEQSDLIVSGATRAPSTSAVYYSRGNLLTGDNSYESFSVSWGGGSASRNICKGPNDCAMQIVQTGGGSSLNIPGALFCHDCRSGYPGVVTPKTTLGNIYFERNYWYGVIGDKIPGKAVFYFYWYDARTAFNTIILSWDQVGVEEY